MKRAPEFRFKYKDKRKYYYSLYREERELWNHYDCQGSYLEYETPIRDGYQRSFEIKSSLKDSPEYPFIEEIMKFCNPIQISDTKDFRIVRNAKWEWLGRKRVRKEFVPLTLLTLREGTKEWKSLSEKAKSYFRVREHKTWFGNVEWERYLPEGFSTNYLVIKVSKHFIYGEYIPNSEWESARKKLDNRLETNNYRPKIYHMLGHPTSGGDDWDWNGRLRRAQKHVEKYDLEQGKEDFAS